MFPDPLFPDPLLPDPLFPDEPEPLFPDPLLPDPLLSEPLLSEPLSSGAGRGDFFGVGTSTTGFPPSATGWAFLTLTGFCPLLAPALWACADGWLAAVVTGSVAAGRPA